MSTFAERLIGASKFNVHIYEEVESDRTSINQAMSVVILSSIAAGIGTISRGGAAGIVWGTIGALSGWFIWALLTYLIGTKILPEKNTQSDMGELLRTIGFASSPGLIRIFGIIPGITGIVFFVASIWMLAAMVTGVRQALDYTSTWRAVGVVAIGWLIQAVILTLLLYSAGELPES